MKNRSVHAACGALVQGGAGEKPHPSLPPRNKEKKGRCKSARLQLMGSFFCEFVPDSMKVVLIKIKLGWFQENSSLNSCRKQELCVVMEKWLLPGQSLAATLTTALSFHSRSRIKTK